MNIELNSIFLGNFILAVVWVGALWSLMKGGYIIVVGKKQIDAIPNITTSSILILQFDPLADSHNFINVFQMEYS